MTEPIPEKEIHLRDYFRVVQKRRGTVFAFFILPFVTVIIATFTATPMYRAVTKVMIERNTSSALTSAYRYMPYDPEFLETQYQLIKSAAVVQKVIENLNLERFYSLMIKENGSSSCAAMVNSWIKERIKVFKETIGIKPLPVIGADGLVEEEQPLTKAEQLEKIIKEGISAEPVANSRVVEISFLSDNPAVAAKVVNSVAQAYIDELVEMQMEASANSIGWMKKKAELQRKKLEDSERELLDYKKEHDILTIEDRLTILPERLSDLSKSLTQAETKRKELSALYTQIMNTPRSQLETIPAILENTSVDSINKAILIAEQKISELSKKYGSKHPRMIIAEKELDDLKGKKASELKKAVLTIKHQYELAQSNEADLKELLDQAKFQTSQLGEKSIQLEILKRKVESNHFLYDALIKKMKEEGITEQSRSVNVWVIEAARIPKFPAVPKKKRNILLGMILGVFGGIGMAFFLEYLDNTIKTPEDVEVNFHVSVMATVDLFENKKQSIVEHVLGDPSSIISERFKGLRTSLFLSAADRPPKTIQITSVAPAEGKSSICTCLGLVVAQTGKKVLIVDAGMRRPTQHKHFGLENDSGLSSFLAGMELDAIRLIRQGVDQNGFLDIIPAGPIPPNPSELLSSPKVRTLIDKTSRIYDMVIVDSPPIASVTDPLIISKHVDGLVIVAWAGKTTHELFAKGIKELKDVSAPVTGVVLNRFNAQKSGYYYNYGDYYYASNT
jgi:capsular exopolysaccharide synthesis family protein